MKTKRERIQMIERNLAENDKNLADGKINKATHAIIKRDGKNCIGEIIARKQYKPNK